MTDRITRDPAMIFGKPVNTGTYAVIGHILRCLAAGDSLEDVARYHPQFTLEEIQAALIYAADFIALAHMADRLANEASKPKWQPPTEEAP